VWIDPHGHELLYSHKRSGHWAIGRYYTADVIRTGTRTQLYGTPMYTGDRDAGDELRRQLWVKDTAARTRLADLATERKAAQRNAIDEPCHRCSLRPACCAPTPTGTRSSPTCCGGSSAAGPRRSPPGGARAPRFETSPTTAVGLVCATRPSPGRNTPTTTIFPHPEPAWPHPASRQEPGTRAAGQFRPTTTFGGTTVPCIPPTAGQTPPSGAPATFTDGDVLTALNEAADDILDAVDAGDEGLRDALNLMINATIAYLRGEARGLRQAVEHSYGEDYETVLGWAAQAA
jgi:hypothetical protein